MVGSGQLTTCAMVQPHTPLTIGMTGHTVAQWLKQYATSRNVAGVTHNEESEFYQSA
jgi:hypothetical protein